jgi:hypothetical protein
MEILQRILAQERQEKSPHQEPESKAEPTHVLGARLALFLLLLPQQLGD